MMPGYGETLIAEGDPLQAEERELLLREFRRQLDEGMWAAVPVADAGTGRREALLVTDFDEVPEDAERVLFWPRAAGGAPRPARATDGRARGGGPGGHPGGAGGRHGAPGAGAGSPAAARGRDRRGLPSWIREAPLPPDEAERRSLELLRSVVNEDEWDQFREPRVHLRDRPPRRARPAGPPARRRGTAT